MKSIITTIALAFSILSVAAQETTGISKRDEKFVLEAALIGTMEVKVSQLALTNANSAEVRSLAQSMIDDHTASNAELKAYADNKNVLSPTELDNKQRKCYYKLSKLQGPDFDKKYLKTLKKSHKKAICIHKKAAKKATDPELKSWASQKVPQLQHHLEMVESTCKMLK